jgi:hypothetical protein
VGWKGEKFEELIVNFPLREVDRGHWAPEVGEFVQQVMLLTDVKSASYVRQRMNLAGGIGTWAADRGVPLDRECVFDPDVVQQFGDEGMHGSENSKVTNLSVLRRLARMVTVKAPWDPPRSNPQRTKPQEPYSPDEVARLDADADAQKSRRLRLRFQASLDLSLGAGLDGRWVVRVLPEDIVTDADGVTVVRVGTPAPREVPVLPSRVERLLAVAAEREPGQFMLGNTSASSGASHLLRNIDLSPSTPRLNLYRARSTWVLNHLLADTPVRFLMDAAGTESSGARQVLSLVEFLPQADPAAYRRALTAEVAW